MWRYLLTALVAFGAGEALGWTGGKPWWAAAAWVLMLTSLVGGALLQAWGEGEKRASQPSPCLSCPLREEVAFLRRTLRARRSLHSVRGAMREDLS